MGKCLSQSTVNSQPSEIVIEPGSNPSDWNREQVLIWLKTTDLIEDDQNKLIKKFKRYKIDGDKLIKLTDISLKQKLKIGEIGLRLELMKAINKKRSYQDYPSPLYEKNKYQLPQYYPFDYKYRLNIDDFKRKLLSNSKSECLNKCEYHQYNKSKHRLSWTVGTVVLINCPKYAIWCAGQIESISYSQFDFMYNVNVSISNDQYVTVAYDLGNGQIEHKTVNRFDTKAIKSDDRFLQNRLKLTKSCIIEYDTGNGQWIPSYIRGFGSKNDNDFIIAINNIIINGSDMRCNRWSPKIRCSESLLNLTINSEIHVFNCKINDYCCAKIIDIFNNDGKQLDIFKVIYKTDDNQYFFKYIHQFSANIMLLNNDDERPPDYTDLEVVIYSNHLSQSYSSIKHDEIDEYHSNLLLNGWLRRTLINIDKSVDLINLFILLMNEDDYIGPNYELILYLESKYWSSDIHYHDDYYSM